MSEQMSWHEKGRYVQQRMITHNGLTLCLSQWAQRLGMDASNLQKRLKTWKDQDFALTAPKGTKGKRIVSASVSELGLHSCSYYCDKPECIKSQRDYLRKNYVERATSKPDWKDAPEWAKYRTSDSDGWYCWSENKPKLASHGKFWIYEGKFEYCEFEPTIEERPE